MRKRSSERGSIVLLTAILLPVALLLMGLAVDFGVMYAAGNETQSAADAAAMGGAYYYASTSDLLGIPTAGQTAGGANTVVHQVPSLSVTYSQCNDANGQVNICVTAVAKSSSPVFFAKVFGKKPFALTRTATAITSLNQGPGSLSPTCVKPVMLQNPVSTPTTESFTPAAINPPGPSQKPSGPYLMDFSSAIVNIEADPTTLPSNIINSSGPTVYSDGTVLSNSGGGGNAQTAYGASWEKCLVTAIRCGQWVRVQTATASDSQAKAYINGMLSGGGLSGGANTEPIVPLWDKFVQSGTSKGGGNEWWGHVSGFGQITGMACTNGPKGYTCTGTLSTIAACSNGSNGQCTPGSEACGLGSFAQPVRLIQ